MGEIERDSVGAHLRVRPNNPEKIIENRLSEAENKYKNLTIDKYVIMPDHVHMIINNPGVYDEMTGALKLQSCFILFRNTSAAFENT